MTHPDTVYELRQYTLHPGQRDVLIDLFDREFVESQELLGARLVGQFRDLDRPDRFVWVRGFTDMRVRLDALTGFYGGPAWRAHRDAANATMIDSDDVLLLEPAAADADFPAGPGARPAPGAGEPSRAVVAAVVWRLRSPAGDGFGDHFRHRMAPLLAEAGGSPVACLVTKAVPNDFPALPVREGEHVLVWFGRFADDAGLREQEEWIDRSPAWRRAVEEATLRHLDAPPERLRLRPTTRSLLR